MKKFLALALACVMSLSVLTGCGGSSSSSSGDTSTPAAEETSGGEAGTLTLSLSSSPSRLDPVEYTGTYEGQIIQQVCDRLIEYNDDLSGYVPSLATSWTNSEDGMTYVFQIRQGVKFQNGQYVQGREMTAEDVAWSLNRSATQSANGRLSMLANAEVTGDYEVTCTLKAPNSAFLTALTDAGNSIVAKEEVEGWGADFGYNLTGTGAFYLTKFELDEQAVMTANEEYWLGVPNIKTLTFKFISDSTQAANALITGETDLATMLSGEAINTVANAGGDIEQIKIEALKINYVRFNYQNGPTADAKVRQAMIQAVDLDAIRSALYLYNEVKPAYLPLPYGSWGYDAQYESLVPGYDLEAAKALMREAGYDPDGQGSAFSINIYVSNTQERSTLATMLQAYWSQIGIDAKVNVTEWGTFSATAASGNADVYAMSWTWYPDPYFFLNNLFHSNQTASNGNGALYVEPQIDEWLDAATATTVQEERAEYYGKVLEKATADYTGIYYANPYDVYGINKRVQDFTPRADGKLRFIVSEDGMTVSRNTSVV